MNRADFLKKLIAAYPMSFYDYGKDVNGKTTKTPKNDILQKYKDGLPAESEFYEDAYLLMLKENTESKAPEPASINAWLRKAKPLEKFQKLPDVAEPIPDHCKAIIEELRKQHRLRKIGVIE
ncbi:MAG: hypothetical protein II304_02680 [Bacteroidales bacterium]|nr:hypothetical protein [Bacteroidales bacterium]